ncbi:hypothetical protein EFD62_16080 [Acetivibrio mesophilus]|uniref:Uncharacterized protein n=2 Tax=Acetivibrio mesophilus TaxID=2487273 RepID=A0A4Q0I0Z6_9FIRM|nr:hypothetical protein EFD62_16080 [Acetivibrio mesophilus]
MTEEELCEEIIRMITTGEVDEVSIFGITAADETLVPLTDAEEIIKALGFYPNATIEQDSETHKNYWTVHSNRTTAKEGIHNGDKS